MTGQMNVNIDINKKDCTDFYRYYYFKKQLKNKMLMYGIMAITLPLLWKEGAFHLSIYIRDVVFCMVFFSVVQVFLALLLPKITFLLSKKSSMLGKKTILLSAEGFTEESENGTKHHPWTAIKSIEEDKSYLYIFAGKREAHMIPKRSFLNTNEQDRFVKELEYHRKQTAK